MLLVTLLLPRLLRSTYRIQVRKSLLVSQIVAQGSQNKICSASLTSSIAFFLPFHQKMQRSLPVVRGWDWLCARDWSRRTADASGPPRAKVAVWFSLLHFP